MSAVADAFQSEFELDLYLERVAFDSRVEPTLSCLEDLCSAHAQRIPYENLEIHCGRFMSLDQDEIDRLILRKGRGGYCFQMNLLFERALHAIGFKVVLRQGRGWLTSGGAIPPRAHLVLEVLVNGRAWLADAGWGGGGLRRPVPIEVDASSMQGHRSYRLSDAGEFGFMLERLEGDVWHGLYSFERTACQRVDLEYPNYYLSTSPDSFFVQNRACAIATPDGEKTMFNRTLRVRNGDDMAEEDFEDDDSYRKALVGHFGIVLGDEDRLGPL